jgi:hypothetical protein
MPEVNPHPGKQLVAVVMFISAIVLFALSMLFFAGTFQLPDEIRVIASIAVAIAAAVDLLIAIRFFRQGQSS